MVNPAQLSRQAAITIANPANIIFVSAASAWEIATKVRIGKMHESEALEARFPDAMEDAGFIMLSIDVEIALRAARLTADHRDPFDRVLAAHALALDIPVISIDAKLDQFGVRRIW